MTNQLIDRDTKADCTPGTTNYSQVECCTYPVQDMSLQRDQAFQGAL